MTKNLSQFINDEGNWLDDLKLSMLIIRQNENAIQAELERNQVNAGFVAYHVNEIGFYVALACCFFVKGFAAKESAK